MVRTQIQLPDALYARAKRIAKQHEISLAELVRRGLEHMVHLFPVDPLEHAGWKLPAPLGLGELRAPVEDWRELANAVDSGAQSAE
jgi:hypothetical protein